MVRKSNIVSVGGLKEGGGTGGALLSLQLHVLGLVFWEIRHWAFRWRVASCFLLLFQCFLCCIFLDVLWKGKHKARSNYTEKTYVRMGDTFNAHSQNEQIFKRLPLWLHLWFSVCRLLVGEGTWQQHLHLEGRLGLDKPAAGAGTIQRCWSDLGKENNWSIYKFK